MYSNSKVESRMSKDNIINILCIYIETLHRISDEIDDSSLGMADEQHFFANSYIKKNCSKSTSNNFRNFPI